MFRFATLLLFAVVFTPLFAGDSDPVVLGDIGGRAITQHDYDLLIRFKKPEMKMKNIIPPHEELFREFATDLVLAASVQAGDKNFTDRGDLKWKLWELETKEAFARLLEERMFVKEPLPEEKIREYYEGHAEEFSQTASFTFRNVFLDTTRLSGEEARQAMREEAQAALEKLERLKNPEGVVAADDFVRIAAETMGVSEQQIQPRGPFRIGHIKPALEKAALALDIGQISEIIQTENGYYILQLVNSVEAGLRLFEEVAPKIEERLTLEIQKGRFAELRKRLFREDRFEIHEEGLANLVRWASDPGEAENALLAETESFQITVSDYIDYLKYSGVASPPKPTQSPEEIRESHSATLFNDLLYPAVAYDEAAASGYTDDATFQGRIRIGRIAILGEEHFSELAKRRLEAMAPISDEEIQAYYTEHAGDFMTDPISRFREIAVRPEKATRAREREFAFRAAEDKALEVLELIRSGSPEEEVIRKFSDGEEADEGGLTPALTPGRRFSARVWDELRTLEIGEWTKKPYRERGKAILLKLEELTPSQQKPLDSVRGQIAQALVRQRALEETVALRKEILESKGYRVNEENLKALPPIPEL